MKLNKKKVLNFNKETLIKLHETQMQALVGAKEQVSNLPRPTITIDPDFPQPPEPIEIDYSCCKHSCDQPPKNPR